VSVAPSVGGPREVDPDGRLPVADPRADGEADGRGRRESRLVGADGKRFPRLDAVGELPEFARDGLPVGLQFERATFL